ncbi:MAG: metallophosphatase [Microbacteriaceae bacterium]|nr:metallophosphatase [Microbacteriaceae bacterium]
MPDQTPLRILHLSDTHLFGDASLHYGRVDTTAALHRVLAAFSEIRGLDLVVGSGDLSDDGSPDSYAALKAALEPWASARGARVVYAMGNHDQRAGFREILGDGHDSSEPAAPLGPIDGVSRLGRWRIVTLDSSVPGSGYGELDTGQLDWLATVLATPAEAGTILVMHHPPVPASTSLLQSLELHDPGRLAEIVRGSDVRLILAGHYHHGLVGTFAGVPVNVTTAIANTIDPLAPAGTERAVMGSGGTLVTIGVGERAGADIRFTPLRAYGPSDGTEVYSLDRDTVSRIAAEAGRRS